MKTLSSLNRIGAACAAALLLVALTASAQDSTIPKKPTTTSTPKGEAVKTGKLNAKELQTAKERCLKKGGIWRQIDGEWGCWIPAEKGEGNEKTIIKATCLARHGQWLKDKEGDWGCFTKAIVIIEYWPTK